MKRKRGGENHNTNGVIVNYEAELWQVADALHGSPNAGEYKDVVLISIFLKYVSDASEEQHALFEAKRDQGAVPEDADEYPAVNVFGVSPGAGRAPGRRIQPYEQEGSMPREKWTSSTGNKCPFESSEHRDKPRVNNPPVGLLTLESAPNTEMKKT